MRSRPDVPQRPLLVMLALIALLVLAALPGAAPAYAAGGDAPTQAEIDKAVETVKQDPNLAAERSVRTLSWKDWGNQEKKPKNRESRWPRWLDWIPNLFGWIGQASQMLVWLVIAALVGLLLLFVLRLLRDTRFERKAARFIAPTHVQDLDIRPESLPPDIGAAARALWDHGEQRAALALLYRGMLSRLAHVHEVPIRDSSTEGDCLALAAGKLDAARIVYVTQLVRTWQRFTYGGIAIEDAVAHELCAGFAHNLDRAPGDAPDATLAGAGA